MPITQILLTANAGGGAPPPSPAADFTIEWWQKVENNFNNARPWSVGLYPTQKLSLSYESMTTDYFWINDSYIGTAAQNHVGQGWRHMAYVRSNGIVKGYINGTEYCSYTGDGLITDTSIPLYVGTGELAAGTYKGYITDLNIIKGTAKYTGAFAAPTSPISPSANSKLLLRAANLADVLVDSATGKSASPTGTITYTTDSPYANPGPYLGTVTAYNVGLNVLYVEKTAWPDIQNVKVGWTFTSANYYGVVNTITEDALYWNLTLTISSGTMDSATGSFTAPGSIYFSGSSYLTYAASPDWAMDNV